MNKVIGRCSHCGGTVSVPLVWYGVTPPVPRCSNCGATASNRHLPVIDMDPPPTTGPYKGFDPAYDFADAMRRAFLVEDDFDEWGHPRRYTKGGW